MLESHWALLQTSAWVGMIVQYARLQALLIRSVDSTRLCARHSVLVGEFSTPFDEFEHRSRSGSALRRRILALWTQTGLRGLSFSALWVAILTASFLIVRHALPLIMGSQPPITLKSGVPLIAIGISYFALIITLRRTLGQRLVGIFMGLACCGDLEQFLSDRAVISFIDDIVATRAGVFVISTAGLIGWTC